MRWNLKPTPDSEKIKSLQDSLNIDELIATLLLQRGIETFEQARQFFRPKLEDLHDPLTRDKNMAEIIIEAQKSDTSKAIIWGHNVHIAKDKTMAEVEAMGGYLKQKLKDRYYALGFDTYKGNVNVIAEGKITKHSFESGSDTFSGLFSKAKDSQFFLSFNPNKANPFAQNKNKITNIYSVWTNDRALPILPGSDFDSIIFVRETTASLILK